MLLVNSIPFRWHFQISEIYQNEQVVSSQLKIGEESRQNYGRDGRYREDIGTKGLSSLASADPTESMSGVLARQEMEE